MSLKIRYGIIIESIIGRKIRVDANLTFEPKEHVQGHNSQIVFFLHNLACHSRVKWPVEKVYPFKHCLNVAGQSAFYYFMTIS